MSGLPTINFFNVLGTVNAKTPKFVPTSKYKQPTTGSFADEMVMTPTGGFLMTLMGSMSGGTPGAVAEYDNKLNLIGQYPVNIPEVVNFTTMFNPHGFAVDWTRKTAVSVDFVEPASTLMSYPGSPAFRTTVRVW